MPLVPVDDGHEHVAIPVFYERRTDAVPVFFGYACEKCALPLQDVGTYAEVRPDPMALEMALLFGESLAHHAP